jgi:hypothetical protein
MYKRIKVIIGRNLQSYKEVFQDPKGMPLKREVKNKI